MGTQLFSALVVLRQWSEFYSLVIEGLGTCSIIEKIRHRAPDSGDRTTLIALALAAIVVACTINFLRIHDERDPFSPILCVCVWARVRKLSSGPGSFFRSTRFYMRRDGAFASRFLRTSYTPRSASCTRDVRPTLLRNHSLAKLGATYHGHTHTRVHAPHATQYFNELTRNLIRKHAHTYKRTHPSTARVDYLDTHLTAADTHVRSTNVGGHARRGKQRTYAHAHTRSTCAHHACTHARTHARTHAHVGKRQRTLTLFK